jgi:voltage-gated potassium channel
VTDGVGTELRRDRWEAAANWPLTVAAVVFLAAYAWPILAPDLDQPWPGVCRVLTWATWGAFAVDYVVRLALSRSRSVFVRRNLLDLAVVALPLLRPLRLLRLVTLLSVLNRYAGGSLRGRVAVYVAGSTVLVLFVASLAVLDAERGQAGANIATFGDALWWAMTTVTTVGYGDRFPVSGTGRFIAGGLMLAGIALLGVVTASLASWLLERVREVEEEGEAATRRDVVALTREVAALRDELARNRSPR